MKYAIIALLMLVFIVSGCSGVQTKEIAGQEKLVEIVEQGGKPFLKLKNAHDEAVRYSFKHECNGCTELAPVVVEEMILLPIDDVKQTIRVYDQNDNFYASVRR